MALGVVGAGGTGRLVARVVLVPVHHDRILVDPFRHHVQLGVERGVRHIAGRGRDGGVVWVEGHLVKGERQ